ncbi:hypothetical protein AMJ80_01030 [bacterium SM23_31]|nr:MAG: hypothetical protein AMJ80_01030 [bacterium SM23_31]
MQIYITKTETYIVTYRVLRTSYYATGAISTYRQHILGGGNPALTNLCFIKFTKFLTNKMMKSIVKRDA